MTITSRDEEKETGRHTRLSWTRCWLGCAQSGGCRAQAQHVVVQGTRTLLKNNQPDGFDCPGCAWPDPRHTSAFEFCENGAKAVTWESTAKPVGPDFFAENSLSDLKKQSDYWIEGQGRLTHPLQYNAATDHYEVVDWSVALAEIGKQLSAISDPDQVTP